MQKFHYSFYHKSGQSNRVDDALSRQPIVLTLLKVNLPDIESIKDLYATDEDFATVWDKCLLHDQMMDSHIAEGFLFKGNQLCIPRTSLREFIMQDMHSGELATHMGKDKTIALITERFY